MTFYALCHTANGVEVKRLQLNAQVQTDMVTLFNHQEGNFLNGVDTEVPFDGDWKPDDNEIMTIDNHPEVASVIQAVSTNAQAIPNVDVNNFLSENIKAILTAVDINGNKKLLIQRFTERQVLSKKVVLTFDNNHFNRLQNTAFSLEEKLSCVVEGCVLKFKSYHNTRGIFDLTDYYVVATDTDIDEFFDPTLPVAVDDLQQFKDDIADQGTRKLIHSILNRRNLNQYTGLQIQTAANDVDLALNLDANGKVVLPPNRKEAKNILRFLDDKYYEAPLSEEHYITNSNRPAG